MRLEEALNPGTGAYFEGTLIESRQTPHQLIEIFDTPELGKLMRIDGANMLSERDEFFYHENLVHPVAITHPSPKRVLIIGGGDGGSTEEMLKHPSIEKIVIAELDAGVIEMARKHFHAVHRGAFEDARVDIQIGDGMNYLRASGGEWDLIFLDLPDPGGAADALYTPGFYADCRRALRDGGALVAHLGSPFSHPGRFILGMNHLRAVYKVVAPYFVHIPAYGATWGFAVASDTLDPRTLSAVEIDARLTERDIGDRRFHNGDTHRALFALPGYIRDALATTA
jgi:spermidine synthase